MHYDIVQGQRNRAMLTTKIDKYRQILPQEISAKVLEKMKWVAEKRVGRQIRNAVVTVPAYFDDQSKKATMEACKIAGLECRKIITEPTAAAIAYGINRTEQERKMCVVFDFGGGTLDITTLAIINRQIEVRSCNGDQNLGGIDVDNALVKHCISLIEQEHSINIKSNLKAYLRLRKECQIAKHTLQDVNATSATIQIDNLTDDIDEFEVELSREEYNQLVQPVFEKCLIPLQQSLADAETSAEEVDEIILVGGSTRNLRLQEMLSQFFGGKPLNKSINPDEAVAIGATIMAGILSGSQAVSQIQVRDVVPIGIGLKVRDIQRREAGMESAYMMSTMIPKNTRYPFSFTKSFFTQPGQV